MGQTTFANTSGIAYKGSGGISPVFPDVCKTLMMYFFDVKFEGKDVSIE